MERSIATTIHGRYLAIPAATSERAPLLVGFHGYAENAEAQLERLRAIPGGERWVRVSIQALHRFYQSRTNAVVASWMTRQDREAAIADNIGYISGCIDAIAVEWRTAPVIIFAGFSQGVGMAFRAAAHASSGGTGVIAAGGDIPPELEPGALKRLTAALIMRGVSDALYPAEKFAEDERRLRDCSVSVRAVQTDGGHEWSNGVSEAAAEFLRERYPG
jgi:predicted esterase